MEGIPSIYYYSSLISAICTLNYYGHVRTSHPAQFWLAPSVISSLRQSQACWP